VWDAHTADHLGRVRTTDFPINGTTVSYYSQPVTLTVATGVATGGALPTTVVEVATDVAFGSILSTQAVTPDASGHATVALGHLAPATTYYWRVRTTAGNNPGVVSTPESLTIGPQLVIQPPVPVQPIPSSFPHRRPTFVVANAAHTGPDVTLTYRFDVATDAGFGDVVATGTAPEGAGQTTFTPAADLISGRSYFWRAQASDIGKGVSSAYSPAQAFTTINPDDGAFRYTVAIHAPTYCSTHSTHSGTFVGPGWTLSDYTFAGTLTVTSDTLEFSPDPTGIGSPLPPLVQLTRAHNQISGSILGVVSYNPFLSGGGQFNGVGFNGAVQGDSDNAGHFEGTFDGNVSLDREGFPAFSIDTCTTSGFAWTLTPR
jgi:hypothetical protein